jgi:hypothetical protein
MLRDPHRWDMVAPISSPPSSVWRSLASERFPYTPHATSYMPSCRLFHMRHATCHKPEFE